MNPPTRPPDSAPHRIHFTRPVLCGLLFFLPLVAWGGSVVINEIHYDPEPKEEFVEFIELYNNSDNAVALDGWKFSSGIRYVFPVGSEIEARGYLVLTQDVDAYTRKYGSIFVGGLKAFDAWTEGVLSNGGETVTLENEKGETMDEVDYRVGFPWPVAPNDETGLSMELIHPDLDNELGSSWRPAIDKPTPGKENTVFSEVAPPNIRQVGHTPESPPSSQSVVVSAKVTDPQGVASVTLAYQVVEPGRYVNLEDEAYEENWTTLPMRDDGTGSDQTAGDSVFTAVVPDSVQRHRHLVRYRITVEDSGGAAVRAPFEDDPQPNFAYFCYDGVPPWTGTDEPGVTEPKVYGEDVMNALPVYHLITREEDVLACQYNSANNNKNYKFLGTLVYDGVVYDHMRYRIRGHGSTYNTGKNKWKWRFNRGHLFRGRDDFGRRYREPVRTLNISGMASPWNPANRGICGLDEALAFRLWRMVGVPAANTSYFHFRIIDSVREADPTDQYEGDLWGPYLAIEQGDGRFLKERGLPDGNTYNMHFGNTNYLNQAPGQPTDRSDLDEFVSARGYNKTNPIQPVSWWRENVNLESYYSYRAIWEAVNHSDQRDQENSIYYHNPVTNRWTIIPWDVDLLYEEFDRWGPDAVQTRVPFEQFRKCLEHDELRIEFENRARELQDLLLNDDQLWYMIDETAGFVGSKDASDGGSVRVVELTRDGVVAMATTDAPHGFQVDDTVYLQGLRPPAYSGAHEVVEVVSETRFAYRPSIFAPPPEEPAAGASVSTVPTGGGWWEIDRDRWNHHLRSRAVEGPSTGTGSFYVNPFRYTRFSGKVRTLVSPDFPGMVQWVKNFTVPPGFGGAQLAALAESANIPDTPVISYVGPDGFPADQLRFETTEFEGGTLFQAQEFAGLRWRLAEISNPRTEGYEPGEAMVFEIDSVWESEVISVFEPMMAVPADVARPGHTYRARVRMLNQLGEWSHWSEPVEFVAGQPDVAGFRDNLVISEIMYHPGPPSAEEVAAGFDESDFEFVEIHNKGDATLDLRGLRFTKGMDFDFVGNVAIHLAPGGYAVVARDREAFLFRYGGDLAGLVLGEWGMTGGKLDNAGERLKLSYGAGTSIVELVYDDEGDWPVAADGEGKSLVLRAGGDPALASSWTASGAVGGSPGKAEENNGAGRETIALLASEFDEEMGMLTMAWKATVGESYVIEVSDDLKVWRVFRSAEQADSGREEASLETGVGENRVRYFRVREMKSGER